MDRRVARREGLVSRRRCRAGEERSVVRGSAAVAAAVWLDVGASADADAVEVVVSVCGFVGAAEEEESASWVGLWDLKQTREQLVVVSSNKRRIGWRSGCVRTI